MNLISMADENQDKPRKDRRTLLEMTDAIIAYAEKIKGGRTVILSELAKSINVNSQTAKMWLDIFFKIQHDCPTLNKEEVGRFTTLKFDYFSPVKQYQEEINRRLRF